MWLSQWMLKSPVTSRCPGNVHTISRSELNSLIKSLLHILFFWFGGILYTTMSLMQVELKGIYPDKYSNDFPFISRSLSLNLNTSLASTPTPPPLPPVLLGLPLKEKDGGLRSWMILSSAGFNHVSVSRARSRLCSSIVIFNRSVLFLTLTI